MDPRDLRTTIRDLIEPVVQMLGFDVVAIEWASGARRPVLRISVDGQGGVGADDCARISHRVSPLLDAEDPIPGAYDLEISSPGIERPVQRLDDFRRFTGYQAKIRLETGFPRRRYTGALHGVHGDTLHVEVAGELHELPLDGIEACHLVLDLDSYAALAEGLPPIPSDDATASEGEATAREDAQEDAG